MTAPGCLKRVLCVEDDPDIQVVLQLIFETEGVAVAICGNPINAVTMASEFKPDLVLMDVMMPEQDGPETFRQLQSAPETQKIPVIFMTARIQTQDVKAYQDMGVLDVIAKPFDPTTLMRELGRICEKHHGRHAS